MSCRPAWNCLRNGTKLGSSFNGSVLTKLRQPPGLFELSSRPLETGQVLVEIEVAGLCGSQLSDLTGDKGNERFLPHMVGHEGFGRVVGVGAGVSTVNTGDEVVMHWRKGAGLTAKNAVLDSSEIGPVNSGPVFTLSEMAVVSESHVTKAPKGTPPTLGALLGCALSTVGGALLNEVRLKPGEKVLIVGAGGLGLGSAIVARGISCSRIVAVDTSEAKRRLALAVGADEYYVADPNAPESLLSEEGHRPFDVIVNTTPRVDAALTYFRHLAPGGRILQLGQGNLDQAMAFGDFRTLLLAESISITISNGGGFVPNRDLSWLVDFFQKTDWHPLITHRYSLGDIEDAYSTLQGGYVGRAVFDV